MRYIEADALLQYMGASEHCKDCWCEDNDFECRGHTISRQDLCNVVEDLVEESAEVKPVVRGEWVFNGKEDDAYDVYGNPSWAIRYYCSKCNFEHAFIENHTGQYNYCPQCGCLMRGDEDESI